MRAIDCQAFAGGFTLGTVKSGFELVHKAEMQGGFGVANCTVNRHLLGHRWEAQTCDPTDWEALEAEYVFGNPPCSGFSMLSPRSFRGVNSSINHCMWAFAGYVSRVKPLIAAFESVQQAYTEGAPLMRALHEKLIADTGDESWTLYHVLHNNHSVGGAAVRRRYFWVVSRIPFGVEYPELDYLPNLHDAIGDLIEQPISWDNQPYASAPTRWSEQLRSPTGLVDGHKDVTPDSGSRRAFDLLPESAPWAEGEKLRDWARRYYETVGHMPESWGQQRAEKFIARDFDGLGFFQESRWKWDRPCKVITGGSPNSVVHPYHYRHYTWREVARIMGYPDDWVIKPLRESRTLKETWGKGIPVHSGEWLSSWVKRSIEGSPGPTVGEQAGEREYLINVTKPRLKERAA